MGQFKEKVSPSLFILVIICFLLPFANISCAGHTESLAGIDLLTGFTVADSDVPPNPLAIIAVVAALIGAILYFLKNTAAHVIQTVLGILGIICLVALKILFTEGANDKGLEVEWIIGYYMAFISFISATAFSIYMIFAPKNPVAVTPTMNTGSDILCPGCNRNNHPQNNWCQFCGANLKGNVPGPINNFEQPIPVHKFEPPKQYIEPVTPVTSSSSNEIAESVTMPLRAESIPVLDNQQVAFLRTQRIGRWELIPILKNDFIIGSDPSRADYQEHSGNLGQIHARIERNDESYRISNPQADCMSYVNDQKLTAQMYPLNPGDVIRLNNIEYIFDLA